MAAVGRWIGRALLGLALLSTGSAAWCRSDEPDTGNGVAPGALKSAPNPAANARPGTFRLVLKHGRLQLANGSSDCGNELSVQPPTARHGQRCGEWRIVPVGDGNWFKILFEGRGWYLDGCGARPHLAVEARGQAAGCQMWSEAQLDNEGWAKLRLRRDGRFLDADHCGPQLGMNAGSDWEGGACQRWKWTKLR